LDGTAAKVAVVTGAGGGLGSVIAAELARDEFQLVLVDRDGRAAERTRATIGPRPVVRETDITDPAAVDALVAGITADFGRLDVLVKTGTAPWR